ncbi:hypothetical protein A4X13_0g6560 [Tilletia indica]|uniref:Uncharacterized protein n=1 Tax=Tilletia indica TaxID=43049 RepID=A0A8T8SNI3_9BASI|nr:hypothetical protein A4X13_0g6560 [Tilletia indica]
MGCHPARSPLLGSSQSANKKYAQSSHLSPNFIDAAKLLQTSFSPDPAASVRVAASGLHQIFLIPPDALLHGSSSLWSHKARHGRLGAQRPASGSSRRHLSPQDPHILVKDTGVRTSSSRSPADKNISTVSST